MYKLNDDNERKLRTLITFFRFTIICGARNDSPNKQEN